jgi:hypothetical protein
MFAPIKTKDRGTRTINGVEVCIVEMFWRGGNTTFEVYSATVDYTESGSFRSLPTDEEIAQLIHNHELDIVLDLTEDLAFELANKPSTNLWLN